jgi:CheY-like chemotaxis protein
MLENGHDFDAIVLDLNMPGMGGAAALACVRQKWADIPVLLATGRADQQAIDLARTTSRVTLLTKPFAPPALNEQLVALVERWPRARH